MRLPAALGRPVVPPEKSQMAGSSRWVGKFRQVSGAEARRASQSFAPTTSNVGTWAARPAAARNASARSGATSATTARLYSKKYSMASGLSSGLTITTTAPIFRMPNRAATQAGPSGRAMITRCSGATPAALSTLA